MKKFLSFLIVLAMLLVPALAEDLDLASMTTDELLELRMRISTELSSRYNKDINPMVLYNGDYIVGVNISAGTYLVYNDLPSSGSIKIVIYDTKKEENQLFYYYVRSSPYYIILEDGNELCVRDVDSAHLEPVDPPVWVPQQ